MPETMENMLPLVGARAVLALRDVARSWTGAEYPPPSVLMGQIGPRGRRVLGPQYRRWTIVRGRTGIETFLG